MAYGDKIRDVEELNEENIGFRFLWNPSQLESSAMLKIQWCLAPQVLQYLKEEEVTDARVFVTMRDPHSNEKRFVFPLMSEQEIIEFHRPGGHTISGTIVWGDKEEIKAGKKDFLKKVDRHVYEHNLQTAVRRHDCQSFGQAELSVEVASGFFAPPLSAFEDWYVNLWFGEPAWDECEIRRRKWIAYTIQPILLAIWIPILCTIRMVVAFWLSTVCLRKGVSWNDVIHPFGNTRDFLMSHGQKRWENRPILRLLVPVNQIYTVFVSLFCAIITNRVTGWSFLTSMIVAYCIIMLLLVAINSSLLMDWVEQYMEEREKRLRTELLDVAYSDLLCTTAPADGTLRTKRRGFKSYAVLAYHDLKVAVCRPTARG